MTTPTGAAEQKEGYWKAVRDAADALNAGALVVFPTETVYGLAARADLPDALNRLYAVKDRPGQKPFTVHIARRADAELYIPNPSPIAKRLIRKGWPGPLTLILTSDNPANAPIVQNHTPDLANALFHDNTIGLRCPDHDAATEFLAAAKGPVVAASANPAGDPPPTSAEQAITRLEGRLNLEIDFCLDGGPAWYNTPSTIVKVDGMSYEIVREGVFDQRMIRAMTGLTILFVCTGNTCRSPMAEGLAKKQIADQLAVPHDRLDQSDVVVLSAGVAAGPGAPPAENAVSVLAQRGVDIAASRTTPLSRELIRRADHIFTMTQGHRRAVVAIDPTAADKTRTLIDGEDVSDPVGSDHDVYAACADMIDQALKTRLSELEL